MYMYVCVCIYIYIYIYIYNTYLSARDGVPAGTGPAEDAKRIIATTLYIYIYIICISDVYI